ncbi:MAG: DUF308 domain-containing protein, partial [Candidatus Competibacteraceae bacterium]|nr:DUF308 domain-containing protein [Candidatus Competibacteraceae bacterium]
MNEQALVQDRIRALADNRGWLFALGAILIVLGSLAILVPPAAALAVELLLGWLLVIGGIALIVHAFRARAWGGLAVEMAVGLVYLLVGVLLLVYPLEGILTLTLLLAALLIAEGALRSVAALRLRPTAGWGWLLANGILS